MSFKSRVALGGDATMRLMRRFGKELLIAGCVTLFAALAVSGLSRLPTTSPESAKLDVEMPRRSSEPPAMVERRFPPENQAAVRKDGENADKAHTAKRAVPARSQPAAAPSAAAAPVPRPDPQRAPADLASTEKATPTDIRSEAQRIADERQREEGLWQRMTRTARTATELIPGRKVVAQAVETVRDGMNDLINVLR